MIAGNPLLLLSRRRILPSLIACSIALNPLGSRAQTWREVQSPHFRVLTDGSERDGRDVAKEFEQMRSVFAVRFNNATLETGAPLLVVAVREQGLHALSPSLWKDRDRVVGKFSHGWERQYAMVRLDTDGDQSRVAVFHEYAYTVFHANLHWLPSWLDEGLAEFYGYTQFQSNRIYIGAPSLRLAHLRSENLIPIKEMLIASNRTYARDIQRNDLFQGEAWAMVHYMTFAPDMGGGAKLGEFMNSLEAGTPQAAAFQQVFGDPKAFEEKLSSYIHGTSLKAAVLPPTEQLDAKTFSAKILTAAEADYDIGSFDVGVHDFTEARKQLQAAESADPALGGPHEELGFLLWRRGQDADARTEWQKAVAADPSCYRAAFALLMSGVPMKQQSPQQLEQTRQALEAITRQAPKFAPVLAELALVQWRLGHLNEAYKSSLAAEKLEPWRAGYHLLTVHILAQGQRSKLAAEYARLVAARWYGSDHDEAVDLWSDLPPAARGDGPALTLTVPADSEVARGTILSSSCDKTVLSLVLQPAAASEPPLTLVTNGPYESGFSDTLWVGEDHYTTCFHLAGLPALVAYKVTEPGVARLLALEVRDDLPQSGATAATLKEEEAGPPLPR